MVKNSVGVISLLLQYTCDFSLGAEKGFSSSFVKVQRHGIDDLPLAGAAP